MRLPLHELCTMHPFLGRLPTDHARCGGLALQRAGHGSPVRAETDHNGLAGVASIEWILEDIGLLPAMDSNRVTEDGAEGVALAYINVSAGWVVKRRLQRGERADWLLRHQQDYLALEVSGTSEGDPHAR